jgi:hypothetical protein
MRDYTVYRVARTGRLARETSFRAADDEAAAAFVADQIGEAGGELELWQLGRLVRTFATGPDVGDEAEPGPCADRRPR